MAGDKNGLKSLESRYGYAILALFVCAFILTPLYNSTSLLFGIPTFFFVGVILIPIVTIALTWVFRAQALKATGARPDGGEQS